MLVFRNCCFFPVPPQFSCFCRRQRDAAAKSHPHIHPSIPLGENQEEEESSFETDLIKLSSPLLHTLKGGGKGAPEIQVRFPEEEEEEESAVRLTHLFPPKNAPLSPFYSFSLSLCLDCQLTPPGPLPVLRPQGDQGPVLPPPHHGRLRVAPEIVRRRIAQINFPNLKIRKKTRISNLASQCSLTPDPSGTMVSLEVSLYRMSGASTTLRRPI